MRRCLLVLILVLYGVTALSQEQPAVKSAKDTTFWTKGIVTQVGFSQLSLTNWAAGGSGSISLNTYADAYANYDKNKLVWDNEIQFGYGFIQSFDTGYKKSDDRLIITSKFGYKAVETLYFSSLFDMRTQVADGYNSGGTLVSSCFSPVNVTLGLGIDYKPNKTFSINLAPLTGKMIMVIRPELRSNYGNAADQLCRFELGAQLKADAKVNVKDFTVSSTLILFSDYFNKPQNIRVNWDTNVDAKITKFFAITLRTNLIYDDTVKSAILKDNRGNPILDPEGNVQKCAGVQFKELFSVGFSYTFGQKK